MLGAQDESHEWSKYLLYSLTVSAERQGRETNSTPLVTDCKLRPFSSLDHSAVPHCSLQGRSDVFMVWGKQGTRNWEDSILCMERGVPRETEKGGGNL